jgi:coenzyme F420-reducing hydrogenase gamma subunit
MVVFIETLNKRYDDWMKKMKITNFRALKRVEPITKMDIAIVEGAISTESEISKLKDIRKNAGKLVALGSGAVEGFPSDQRNKFNKRIKNEIQPIIEKLHQIPEIKPLGEFVKVDDEINGCPVDEKLLIEKIDGYLADNEKTKN